MLTIYRITYDWEMLGDKTSHKMYHPTLTDALAFIERNDKAYTNWHLFRDEVVPGSTPATLCNALNGLNWVQDTYVLNIHDGSVISKHAKHVDP